MQGIQMVLDDFKPLEIQHKEIFKHFFLHDPPETSELTFTNLFIWRHHYHPMWLQWEDCILIIFKPEGMSPFCLPLLAQGIKERPLISFASN